MPENNYKNKERRIYTRGILWKMQDITLERSALEENKLNWKLSILF